jgi:hypothetical protein
MSAAMPSSLTSVTLLVRSAHDILGRMSDPATKATRKLVTAQNMEEAKAAAYTNDPQTELVILGLSENGSRILPGHRTVRVYDKTWLPALLRSKMS